MRASLELVDGPFKCCTNFVFDLGPHEDVVGRGADVKPQRVRRPR